MYIVFITVLLACPVNSPGKTFEDVLGRKVSLAGDPIRIISLAANLTEILYYLGLEDRVVGVTNFSNYPPAALEKPRVGSYVNLNVEKIISLSPDLVIGTRDGNSSGDVALLEQAGISVFIVNPRSVESVISSVARTGPICGIPEKAESTAADLTRRLESVRSAIQYKKKPLVFLQINIVPIMTVNKTTVHNDLIRLAGGVNMTADEPITYPRISVEEVIRKEPEVIIISSMERGGRFEKAKKDWMQWTSLPAVKNKRVCLIDSDLIDRPSPRIIDGLEAMARIIHPELDWGQ
jgi:iron complex transport system substrate-binding protein